MSNPAQRLPLVLVVGFLGSGKTTLLRRIIQANRDRRLAYLVNEFSSVDVDGAELAKETDDVIPLPGGSIFCRCLVTEFVGQLQRLMARAADSTAPFTGVVIEASGVADPRAVETLLRESRLDRHYRLSRVVAVVDPGSFLKLLETLPNVRNQIECADQILLNKVDCYPPRQVDEAEERLRQLNASALIARARFADVELDLFGETGLRGIQGELAPCRDPRFTSVSLRPIRDVNAEEVKALVQACGSDLYRLKGTLRIAGRPHRIDYSASGLAMEPDTRRVSHFELVMVTRAEAADTVRDRFRASLGNHDGQTGS